MSFLPFTLRIKITPSKKHPSALSLHPAISHAQYIFACVSPVTLLSQLLQCDGGPFFDMIFRDESHHRDARQPQTPLKGYASRFAKLCESVEPQKLRVMFVLYFTTETFYLKIQKGTFLSKSHVVFNSLPLSSRHLQQSSSRQSAPEHTTYHESKFYRCCDTRLELKMFRSTSISPSRPCNLPQRDPC